MNILKSNICVFVGCTIDVFKTDDKKDMDDEFEEKLELLSLFVEDIGMTKIYIFPNFSIGGILGPQGYVAEIHNSRYFSAWMLNQPLFRTISFFEIYCDLPTILKYLNSDDTRDYIRKGISLETSCYPTLSDTAEGNWAPALGHSNSSIGIYSFEEKVDHEQVTRYFVGVHSGLHYQTCHLLHEKLMEYTYTNSDITNGKNGQEMKTVGDVFEDGLLLKMSKISKENNRRLATQFMRMLELRPKDFESQVLLSESRAITTNLFDSQQNIPLIEEALKWWPKGKYIFRDQQIAYDVEEEERDEEIEKRLKISDALIGAPIGSIFLQSKLKAVSSEEKSGYEKLYKPNIVEKRETICPIIECDYNTFRIKGDHILYYNNCCCTVPTSKEPQLNIVKQLSLTQGYEIYNSNISKNLTQQQFENAGRLPNKFGDGFPVIFLPVKRIDNIKKVDDSIDIFFSYYNGSSKKRDTQKIPKQMKYITKYLKSSDEHHLQQNLFPIDFKPNIIQLLPKFVYLSPDISFDSNYIKT